ncbi:hypothetical protein [Pyramidobacter sp. C12-8]|uniref:hypothetical protein n=1 Tax=Pyramidobacter sp. C12-8 TaxID=1943580 RepID=UPI00098F1C0F|nr:hypothetical protein [Pyramidobacter sp. C12-8]OON89712.1 hypothetical protein B0D78_02475 [Pyramidobacter sp. C12-8]
MDNDNVVTQGAEQQEAQPQVDNRGFDELSDEEQQEVLRASFFGEIEDEPEDEGGIEGGKDEEEKDGTPADGDGADGEGKQPEGAPEGEKAAGEDPAAAAPKGETGNEYTPEEFLLLTPDEVDASRLPQAARIVHERDMQYYRDTIQPQLDELKQLRQFRENVLKAQQAGPQPQAPAQPKAPDFNAQVKAEAMRRLGVTSLDDFNVDHQIMVARVTGELQQMEFQRAQAESMRQAQAAQTQQMYGGLMGDLQREYGADFALIDRYAMAEMQKMPYQSVMQTMAELQSGDAARIKAVYKGFADRYRASKQPAAPAQPPAKKAAEAPPKVIGGSGGDAGAGMSWGEKDFARASQKDQVRMLQDAFFKN